MLGVTQFLRSSHHHMTDSKVSRQEKYISDLKKVLLNSNPFTIAKYENGTELKLFNLTTKVILPDNIAESLIETEYRGEKAYILFVEEWICGKKYLWEKMSKVKVLETSRSAGIQLIHVTSSGSCQVMKRI